MWTSWNTGLVVSLSLWRIVKLGSGGHLTFLVGIWIAQLKKSWCCSLSFLVYSGLRTMMIWGTSVSSFISCFLWVLWVVSDEGNKGSPSLWGDHRLGVPPKKVTALKGSHLHTVSLSPGFGNCSSSLRFRAQRWYQLQGTYSIVPFCFIHTLSILLNNLFIILYSNYPIKVYHVFIPRTLTGTICTFRFEWIFQEGFLTSFSLWCFSLISCTWLI